MRLLRFVVAVVLAPLLMAMAPFAMLVALGRWVWTGSTLPVRRPPPTTATAPAQDEARRWVEQVLATKRRAERN